MPKAYSYVRFSTPEQREGHSERRQIALAEAYAAQHKLEIDQKTRFEDLGVSAFRGRNAEQGALADFQLAVQEGRIEKGSYLLVESLDRISRKQPRKALRILEDIVESGVNVVTLSDGKMYTEATLNEGSVIDLLISLLIFSRAHEESAMKAKRIRAAWDDKRKRAKGGELSVLTRLIPAWLYVDDKGRIQLDAEKGRVIKRIYREFLEGWSPQRIAVALNADKVPVFGSRKGRATPRWRSSYVAKILDAPSVTGLFIPHEMVEDADGKLRRQPLMAQSIADHYPRVIPQELFEAVRLVRTVPAAKGKHANAPLSNIFAGLARCPRCGETMTRINKGKPPKGGQYLVCVKAKDGAGCKYTAVRYPQVEDAFLGNIQEIVAKAPAGTDSGKMDALLNGKVGELASVVEKMENVLEEIEAGGRSKTLRRRLDSLEEDREALQTEVADLRSQVRDGWSGLVSSRLDMLEEAAERKEIDRGAINRILRQLVQSVTIDYLTGQLHFDWRHGGITSQVFMWAKIPPKKLPAKR